MDAGAVVAAEVGAIRASRSACWLPADSPAPRWSARRGRTSAPPAVSRPTRAASASAGASDSRPPRRRSAIPHVVTPFPLRPVRPPILADVDARPTDHRDLVYATLGTVFDLESGDLFARIAGALSTLDRPCVMTIGDQVSADELPPVAPHVRHRGVRPPTRPPAGVRRRRLPRRHRHGDRGAVARRAARPAADGCRPARQRRPLPRARRRDRARPVTASAHDIAAAVGEVIADPRYADAARRLAAEAAAQPPLEAIADLVTLLAP